MNRNAALVEDLSQFAIRSVKTAGGIRHLDVEFTDRADVILLGHDFFRRAAVSISRTR